MLNNNRFFTAIFVILSYNARMIVVKKGILIIALVLLTTGCSSINADSIGDMLVTFSSNFPQLKKLIFAFSYLAGFWFIMSAVHKFKMLSNPSSAAQTSAGGVIVQLLMGAMLLALPSFIQMVLYSLWGTESIMKPSGFSNGMLSANVERAVVGLIQLLGYVAVVRGLMILARVGRMQQTGRDSFGKGMMHIIGGILSINIVKTIEVLKNSFGL